MVRIEEKLSPLIQDDGANDVPNEGQHEKSPFQGAGQHHGLEIWRIEQMNPVRQDPKLNGYFYTGDCYVVLHTLSKGFHGIGTCFGALHHHHRWNVHFWMGSTSSQEEQGAAAIVAVELSDYLGGNAVQHREIQGHESKQFLSYFKYAVGYLDGGVKSGFKHVDNSTFQKRLYHIKSRNNADRIVQVPLATSSLNQEGVFILDNGCNIFVWIGPNSNVHEQRKGLEFARQLRDEERAGMASVNVIDEHWNTDSEFFCALGDSANDISTTGKTEQILIEQPLNSVKLYKIDVYHKSHTTEIMERPLLMKMLDTKCTYILDLGVNGLHMWAGKSCGGAEKAAVWNIASEFLMKHNYPKDTSVCLISEGAENDIFNQAMNNVSRCSGGEHDTKLSEMMSENPGDEDEQVRDTESILDLVGSIKDSVLQEKSPSREDIFEPSDYFIEERAKTASNTVLYPPRLFRCTTTAEYLVTEEVVDFNQCDLLTNDVMLLDSPTTIFVWIGKNVSNEERQNAIDVATEYLVSDNTGRNEGNTPILTMNEGNEVMEFTDCFADWNYEFQEEKIAGMEYESTTEDPNKFEKNEKHVIDDDQKEQCLSDIKFETVSMSPSYTPRLFQCSKTADYLVTEEVVDFGQKDLSENDVMLLDTPTTIFVWVGRNVDDVERQNALDTAMHYLNADTSGRFEGNTPILTVTQGAESLEFTKYFAEWDCNFWETKKPKEHDPNQVNEKLIFCW